MKGILSEIQEIAIVYASILSQILKIDVTIVDSEYKRIAGTGRLVKEIDDDMSEEGHIFKKVMQTGQTQIVMEPGKSEICSDCDSRPNCRETFHMSTPILVKDAPVGVICFTCFTQKQRNHAIKNLDAFSQFLQQFADLIALKVMEVQDNRKNNAMRELLETIVNRIDAGVIVFQQYHNIVEVNSLCCKILKLKEHELFTMTASISATGTRSGEVDEYCLTIGKNTYTLIGKVFEINLEEELTFFLFQQAERDVKKSLALSQKNARGVQRIQSKSQQINKIKKQILMVADSSSPVLITGEKAVGKETYALAIHEESERREEPIHIVDCSVMSGEMIERELFGIEKSRTAKGKMGKLEASAKGTLVLLEVGRLPYESQLKLLQFLDTQKVIRVGGVKGRTVKTRIVCTTSDDLENLVEEHKYIEALFYRINILPFYIPPLRERKDDIHLLAKTYLKKYAKEMNKRIEEFKPQFFTCLDRHQWPGNIWELRNAMEYAANMLRIDGIVDSDLLPSNIQHTIVWEDDDLNLEHMERQMIERALGRFGNSVEAKAQIAAALGIGMATLYRKLKKYNLSDS